MGAWWILSETAWDKKIDNPPVQALKTWAIFANDVPKGLVTFGGMLVANRIKY
jgi:hypothetical protein